MKNINRATTLFRYNDQKIVINSVNNKKELTKEDIDALKSIKKSKTFGLFTIIIVIIIYIVAFAYGMSYKDSQLPPNTEEVQCHTDSNGIFRTSHPSLKGMTLEEVGMTDETYELGKTFYVYVDIDTQKPVLALTREQAAQVEGTATDIILGSHIFLIAAITFIIFCMQFIGRKWVKYVKKYNLNELSYEELENL